MGISNEVQVPLNGNHLEISRYATKEHIDYLVVSRYILKLLCPDVSLGETEAMDRYGC